MHRTSTRTRRRGLVLLMLCAGLMAALPSTTRGSTPERQLPDAGYIPHVEPDRRPVPILMYHVIRHPYRDAPYPALYVPRAEFAAQMSWLDRHGFTAVTLQRVWDAWHGLAVLPRRPIVVSFDDGYRSHTSAMNILSRHGWPGVLNLDLSNLREWWGLSPRRVRALIAAGWEIDAHSLTHADLPSLSGEALRHEVAGSRAEIRRLFGVPANFFCYPAGRYDSTVAQAVRDAGFLAATTTEFGLARLTETFTLDRVRIDGGDGVAGLERKLASVGLR
jgi:peptidoglycan/xylan/chitin deacetylase (PgdA/CDA1 family)